MRLHAAVFVLLLLAASCERTGDLTGAVALGPGEQGDIRSTRVDLFRLEDTTYLPVASTTSADTLSVSRSLFGLSGIPAGEYFLRAWRDLDGDSLVSDGDLVGVYQDTFARRLFGKPLRVRAGRLLDINDVEVGRFLELEVFAQGLRLNGDSVTEFAYRFNHDVDLTGLTVTFPLLGSFEDLLGPGRKRGDTTYLSPGWQLTSGLMPAGEHRLRFRGGFRGADIDTVVPVDIE